MCCLTPFQDGCWLPCNGVSCFLKVHDAFDGLWEHVLSTCASGMEDLDTFEIFLKNLSDTEKLGEFLGATAKPGEIICLDGDLGAGKTTLSQAIARGLDVPERCYVTSPSFAILHEYEGRMPMYHMDFYRLHDAIEVLDLGFEEYFYMSGLTVIEWSMRASAVLPEERLSLEMLRNDNEMRRVIIRASEIFQKRVLDILGEFQGSKN